MGFLSFIIIVIRVLHARQRWDIVHFSFGVSLHITGLIVCKHIITLSLDCCVAVREQDRTQIWWPTGQTAMTDEAPRDESLIISISSYLIKPGPYLSNFKTEKRQVIWLMLLNWMCRQMETANWKQQPWLLARFGLKNIWMLHCYPDAVCFVSEIECDLETLPFNSCSTANHVIIIWILSLLSSSSWYHHAYDPPHYPHPHNPNPNTQDIFLNK